jgi:hypothetical protein
VCLFKKCLFLIIWKGKIILASKESHLKRIHHVLFMVLILKKKLPGKNNGGFSKISDIIIETPAHLISSNISIWQPPLS